MRRRFRLLSYRDSRDGDVLIAGHGAVIWDCRVCSSENEDRSHCWECSQERGNWICEKCGHLNRKGTDECGHCGAEPDE